MEDKLSGARAEVGRPVRRLPTRPGQEEMVAQRGWLQWSGEERLDSSIRKGFAERVMEEMREGRK